MRDESRRLERQIELLKADRSISTENRDAISAFLDECAAEGLSAARQVKYVYMLRTIVKCFAPSGFRLTSATENELKSTVAQVNRSAYTEATKSDYKKAIKKYYKVLNGRVPPAKTRFIRTAISKPTRVTRADLLTQEELARVVSSFRNIRDKAFFGVLHESAVRPCELLDCAIEDAEFTEDGDFISVRGVKKTPDRRNLLVTSGILLREWIRSHPAGGDPHHPKDPKAPLWVKLEQTACRNCGVSAHSHRSKGCNLYEPRPIERATYAAMHRALKRACARAEIKRPRDHMYTFRHTRITEASQFMSNQQLCKFSGWQPSSGQFEVYVHLTDDDVSSAIRAHYGMQAKPERTKVICRTCGAENPSHATECRRCLRPLSLEAATHLDSFREAVKLVAELHERGELNKAIRQIMRRA